MNRPENGFLIVPRLDKLENGDYVTLIRRLKFTDSKAISKEVLLSNGEWEIIPEGGKYPDIAFLPVTHRIVDRIEEAELVKEWKAQDITEGWNKAAEKAIEMDYGNSYFE